jgi:hypothetical protein
MSTVVEVDVGAGHEAHALEVDGEELCVLSPAAAGDADMRARIRRMMWGVGRNCQACRGCIVGTAQ